MQAAAVAARPDRVAAMSLLAASWFAGLLLAVPPSQQQDPPSPSARRPRVGVFFWHDSPNDAATFAGFRAGLQQAGLPVDYIERQAGGDEAVAESMLAELRARSCDLIVALGTDAARRAKAALPDTPMLFAAVSNPVASGIVADWKPSGTNLCGASNWIPPATVLHVFQLAVPGLQRLGVLRSVPSGTVSQAELAALREFLASPGAPAVAVHEAIAQDAADLPRAVAALLAEDVQAIWVPIDLVVYRNTATVRQALANRGIPLLTTSAAALAQGAVVGAVVDYHRHGQRAAALALAILRDRRPPGSLPIDTMRGCRVVVDLDAARSLGYEPPLSLLVVADELRQRSIEAKEPSRAR